MLKNRKAFNEVTVPNDDARMMEELFNDNKSGEEKLPIEKGVVMLFAYRDLMFSSNSATYNQSEELPMGQLNVFTNLRLTDEDALRKLILESDIEGFSESLLNKALLREKIFNIEKLFNNSSKNEAQNITEELIEDIQITTFYPPTFKTMLNSIDLASDIVDLIVHIILKKGEELQ